MDDITGVLEKIKAMLMRLDFKTVVINGRESFKIESYIVDRII